MMPTPEQTERDVQRLIDRLRSGRILSLATIAERYIRDPRRRETAIRELLRRDLVRLQADRSNRLGYSWLIRVDR